MSKKVTTQPKGITPEEIRAIREGLGLTQAEAGDILGGGPRAFTKYEAGTIKPAQSVVNLLRLLEAEPSALGALSGGKAVPLPNVGQRPFEITGLHVQALSARMLAVAVRKLLSAEARSEGLAASGVHVSGSITTPDGGEDGRIEWSGGPDKTHYLPARLTQIQLKSGPITGGEAAAEVMADKTSLKGMVADVLSQGGTYALICSRQYVQKDIQDREARIRAAVRATGLLILDDQVEFRDADQLAEWMNIHPAIATWVLEHTQPGLTGPFRTFGLWHGRGEHEGSPWIEDCRLPDLENAIRPLAENRHETLRLVGPSGVGKSRLAAEAILSLDDDRADGRSMADLVLYADAAQAGLPAVLSATEHLALSGFRAILVVDRCPPGTHHDLTAHIKRKGSNLSLLSIDDDVPDDPLPVGTVRLPEAPHEVIEGIIENIARGLPSEDKRRLVRLSRGFPKVANLVARGWAQGLPIARATDEALVDSVLLGRGHESPDKIRRVGELIAAFGRVAMESDELSHLMPLGNGITEADVRLVVEHLRRRGVVQRKGRFAVLQPRPIALRLAERQWRHWSPDQWDFILGGDFNSELKIRAAQQLALLNTVQTSTNVVNHVCRYGGPLATPEGITSPASGEVLSSLAEIDGQLVAQVMDAALEGGDLAILIGDTRRHLVWALEKIAFAPDTFEEGANLLFRFALAENETFSNNATGQFIALFPVLLGDTAAGPDQRLAFLRDAARTQEPKERELVVQALLAGIRTSHFSRGVGSESHGSRPALEPWHPDTWGQAWDYVRECIALLTDFAVGTDDAAAAARTGLAHEFRSLVSRGLLGEVETVIEQVTAHHPYWPEALEALADVLKYDGDGLDPADVERVEGLSSKLAPRGWKERVTFFVKEMPWDWPSNQKLEFDERGRRQVEAVRELARELSEHPLTLSSLLPLVSVGNQRLASVFGEAIAEFSDDPKCWLEPIKVALMSGQKDERNFSLLAGYLCGLNRTLPAEVSAFKAEAAGSDVFAPSLPLICWKLGIVEEDIDLVRDAMDAGTLKPDHLMQWTLGGVLAELPPPVVAPLFETLFGHSADGLSVGTDVLGMYVHGRKETLDELRPVLRKLAEATSHWSGSRPSPSDVHHFTSVMEWLLAKGRADPDATAVALTLAKAVASADDHDATRLVEPLMPTLLSGFPEVVWPLLGGAITADRVRAWRMQHLLGDSYAFDHESDPALLCLPEETLIAWCYANPDTAPAFVAGVIPVLSKAQESDHERTLHPLMRGIIDEFGDREGVLRAIYSNIHTFGWTGSRTTYYAQYEKPLLTLLEHPKSAVRQWAKRLIRRLSEEIDGARIEDEEQDAAWD